MRSLADHDADPPGAFGGQLVDDDRASAPEASPETSTDQAADVRLPRHALGSDGSGIASWCTGSASAAAPAGSGGDVYRL